MGIVLIIEQYRSGNKINALLLPNLMLCWNLKGFSERLECNNNYGTNCTLRGQRYLKTSLFYIRIVQQVKWVYL